MINEVTPSSFDSAAAAGPARDLEAVLAACDAHDHVDTLDERAHLELKNRGLTRARLWAADDATGFALLRGTLLDVAVHPQGRRQGIGTELVAAALAGTDHVEAWSHADHPGARALAQRFGIPRVRELLVMSRSASAPHISADQVDGVRVRTFVPADEPALLRVNAAAFAHHPEQGGMTAADFRERAAETWFDPEGLFVAVDANDTMLGFHWTKVHHETDPPQGEVYVVAVDPPASGRGIGKLLTAAGVDHLVDSGVDDIILYVEGDNALALAVYTQQGFEVTRTEVQYSGTLS